MQRKENLLIIKKVFLFVFLKIKKKFIYKKRYRKIEIGRISKKERRIKG